MASTLDTRDGIVSYTLYTKIRPFDFQFGLGLSRHPDLFANKFIGVTLDYFDSLQFDVNACQTSWYDEDLKENADNYHRFMTNYLRSRNKADAARQTWSGYALAEYGFTAITDDDVSIIADPTGNEVYARFHKE
ncbi:MAG: hypothetical protein AAB800_00670 [Patescibacteria group bacterium]